MAAPTLFAAGALFAANSGSNITPVIPASCQANDIMVFAAMCNGSTTFDPPVGWTEFGAAVASANQSSKWFWKRHDGSESDPTAVAESLLFSNTVGGYGRIYVFRGCLTSGTPFEDATNNGTPTLSTTPASPTITTTAADRLAVTLAVIDDDNTWSSGMPPSTYTQVGRVASTVGGDCMMDGITKAIAVAGDVPGVAIGTQSASDYWRVLTFALIPAAAGQSGVGAAVFGGAFAASGRPRTFGTGAVALGGTFTTSGRPRHRGSAATSIGFTGTASGTTVATITGTAAAAFGGTFATQGTDRALGTATATISFTGTAAGIPKTRGTATATFGGTFTSSGTDRARGTATTTLGFAGTATGASIGQTVGTATAALGFTGSTTGQPRTKGTATTTLTFTGTTTGVDRTLGTATTTLGFTTTTQGTTRKLGHTVVTIGFTGAANGNVGDAGAQALTIRAALEPNRWEGTLNLGWTADLRPTAWGAEFAVAAYAATADPAAWEAS